MQVALPGNAFKGLAIVSQMLRDSKAMFILPFLWHADVSEVVLGDSGASYIYSDGTRIDVLGNGARCNGTDEQKCVSSALGTAGVAYTVLEAFLNATGYHPDAYDTLRSLRLGINGEVYARAVRYAKYVRLPATMTIDDSCVELSPQDERHVLGVSIDRDVAIGLGDATVRAQYIIEVIVEHSGYTVNVSFESPALLDWGNGSRTYRTMLLGLTVMSHPRAVRLPVINGDEVGFARGLVSKAIDAVARAADAVRGISVECHYPPWTADSVLEYAFSRGAISRGEVCSEVLAYRLSVLARIASIAYGVPWMHGAPCPEHKQIVLQLTQSF